MFALVQCQHCHAPDAIETITPSGMSRYTHCRRCGWEMQALLTVPPKTRNAYERRVWIGRLTERFGVTWLRRWLFGGG